MFVKTENAYGGLNTVLMILADAICWEAMKAKTFDDVLSAAEKHLWPYKRWMAYKGGSHVAIIHDRERILLITERKV